MNKLIILTILSSALWGQFNIQQHYDLGRRIQTTKTEFFTADEQDVFFTFIDINYDSKHFDKAGATDIWYEAAYYRPTPLLDGKLNATVQYNDGIYFYPLDSTTLGNALEPVWLGGLSYPFRIGQFVLPVDLLVGKQSGSDQLTFQATAVWYLPLSARFTLAGFIDIWTNSDGPDISIMAEPQALVNFGQFSTGLEVEISRGFSGAWTDDKEYFTSTGSQRDEDWWFIPTLFLKYTF